MIIYDPTITGSFQINGTSISSIGDIDNISQSVDVLSNASSSFSSRVSLVEGSVNSLNTASSSYLLNSTDTLDGDLTVTGKITAQEFHTEFISASIIYQSGSTQFGNSSDDTHDFKGTLKLSGSMTYGGTGLTVLGQSTDGTDNQAFFIGAGGAGSDSRGAYIWGRGNEATSGGKIQINAGNVSTGNIELYTGGSVRMFVSSSGKVGIGTNSPNERLTVGGAVESLNDGTGEGGQVILRTQSGGTKRWNIDNYSTANDLRFFTENDSDKTSGSVKLVIRSGGNVGIGTENPGYPFHLVSTSTYQAAVKSTGAQYLLIGSEDANGAGIILDGDSNGDGTGGDYSYIFHENSGVLKIVQDSPSGTNQISFGTAGVENKVVIDGNGNVGIGTTSPRAALEVDNNNATGGDALIVTTGANNGAEYTGIRWDIADGSLTYGGIRAYLEGSGYGRLAFLAGDNAGNTLSEHMCIASEGKVGINIPAPAGRLEVATGGDSDGNVSDWSSNNVVFSKTGGNTRGQGIGFSIHEAGQFNVISSLTPAVRWNTLILRAYDWQFFFGGTERFRVDNGGSTYNSTGTYGTLSSDQRLKQNITPATSKLGDILKLNVVNFNYIDSENPGKKIGFIAQEFEQVFPSLVSTQDTRKYDEDGNITEGYEDSKGLKVGMEFAILTKAIQEQQAIIEDLKARIQTLENS